MTFQQKTRTFVGVNGVLEKPQVAKERGYVVEDDDDNNTVRIGIPYNAEGGYRKV